MRDMIDAIAAKMAVLETQIAELQSQRDALMQAADLLRDVRVPPLPEPAAPRSREQILRELITAAGQQGLSRQQIIRQMSQVCDSPPTSISTMLSRLASHGHIRNVSGRWLPALRTAA